MLMQLTNNINNWKIVLDGDNDVIAKMTLITNMFKSACFENRACSEFSVKKGFL